MAMEVSSKQAVSDTDQSTIIVSGVPGPTGRATRAGSAAARSTTPKNFVCTRDGCNKRFTRDEHLQRHALNHTNGDYTCSRCRAHFKRPDLLGRHLQRHRQRDLEAGAEGHGVLNTRKRAWKALDGTVVQKKPRLAPTTPPELQVPTAALSTELSTGSSTASVSSASSTEKSREWADRLILAAGHISTTHNDSLDPAVETLYAAEATISPPQTHTSSSCLSDPGRQPSAEAESFDASQYEPPNPYLDPALQDQSGQQQAQFASIPSFVSVGAGSITGSDGTYSYVPRPVPQGQQQPQQHQPLDFLFDDVFQPDTASSFNMPYTTAINYNWLFSMDENTFEGTGMNDAPVQQSVQTVQPVQTLQQPISFQSMEQEQQQAQRETNPGTSLGYFVMSPGSGSSQTLVFDDQQPEGMNLNSPPKMQLTPTSRGDAFESPQPSPTGQQATPTTTEPVQYNHLAQQPQPVQPVQPVQTVQPVQHNSHQRLNVTKDQQVCSSALSELERPLSSIHPPSTLPVIDYETRERLLQVVDACHPALPDGLLSTWDHPMLAIGPLQDFCDLFFTRFNTAYPLIHQATFQPAETEPLLLLAVLLLGTTYSSKEAHQLAVCIHDVMRPCIFAHTDFGAKPSLWMLQTILLVECFGKSRAGQKQHDMSHLFHGLLINLIRRSECQSARPTIPPWKGDETPDIVDGRWRKWAVEEEMKRLALLCFMWDTQHAVLFCQSLCMSAFELRLTMPCSQLLWEARTASEWGNVTEMTNAGQDMFFLTALKMYLTTPTASRPQALQQLNALSRVLLLHGLLSISWDMQRRDQTALGVIDNMVVGVGGGNAVGGGGHWQDRMSNAYDRWKADFDAYCADMALRQQRQQQMGSGGDDDAATMQHWEAAARECATFATAYKAIYHAAHVLLNSDFLDVQIYAGARHILGRPVQRGDFIRSERIIKRWAAGTDATAAKAAWHAASLVHDASRHLDDFDAMGLFHVPWCLYLATLTCWVFHHTRPSATAHNQGIDGDDDDDDYNGKSEIVWDARQEMDELLAGMAGAQPGSLVRTQGQRQTGGLVWIMANVLSNVRWGIVHAGVVVLRGLVPLRMINQYEAV